MCGNFVENPSNNRLLYSDGWINERFPVVLLYILSFLSLEIVENFINFLSTLLLMLLLASIFDVESWRFRLKTSYKHRNKKIEKLVNVWRLEFNDGKLGIKLGSVGVGFEKKNSWRNAWSAVIRLEGSNVRNCFNRSNPQSPIHANLCVRFS